MQPKTKKIILNKLFNICLKFIWFDLGQTNLCYQIRKSKINSIERKLGG